MHFSITIISATTDIPSTDISITGMSTEGVGFEITMGLILCSLRKHHVPAKYPPTLSFPLFTGGKPVHV